MNRGLKIGAAVAISGAIAIGIAWLWNAYMVRRPEATRIYRFDQADSANYLAARRFLEHQGIEVEIGSGLRKTIPRLGPNEAVLVTYDASGLRHGLVDSLQTWIAGGGTLLIRAPWAIDPETDTLFLRLGVASAVAPDEDEDNEGGPDPETLTDSVDSSSAGMDPPMQGEEVFGTPAPDEEGTSIPEPTPGPQSGVADSDSTDSVTTEAPPPDSGIPLALPGRTDTLRVVGRSYQSGIYFRPSPLCRMRLVWQDTLDSNLVTTSLGRGNATIFLHGQMFTNRPLRLYDHAELLLELLRQNGTPRKVWIVVAATAPDRRWWNWLWDLGGAVAILALLLAVAWVWNRSRRFGPLLPESAPDHRPILEHVDASARWIWNTPGGPDTLLDALRRSTRSAIATRHPGWARLPDDELCQELSRLHKTPPREIRAALGSDGAQASEPATPQEFIRAVRLLQKLKEHP